MQHWVIIGAGAIGCLWAASLQRSRQQKQGSTVTIIVRDQAAVDRYKNSGGIHLMTPHNSFISHPQISTAENYTQPINRLIIATKAQHTAAALASVKHRLTNEAIILSLQNGMGQQQHILDECPKVQLYCAITTDGAYRDGAFSVVHAGIGKTLIGRYPQSQHNEDEAKKVIDSLSNDQLHIESCDHIEQQLWKKLTVNCLINPLTAIHSCLNGELINHPQARPQLEALALEVDSVVAAQGFGDTVPPSLPSALSIAKLTAANRSSMLADVSASRPTEIDFISGYLCRCAQHHGIAVKVNTAIVDAIKNLQR